MLVVGVARGQPAITVASAVVHPRLLPRGVLGVVTRAGPLPDPGVAGQRGVELGVGEPGGGRLAEGGQPA